MKKVMIEQIQYEMDIDIIEKIEKLIWKLEFEAASGSDGYSNGIWHCINALRQLIDNE